MRLLFEVKYGDMAAHADLNNAERLAVLARCKARFEQLLAEGAAYRLSDLAVDGNDLLSLGYAAGPAIGASLDALLDAVVDGQLANERQTLLAAATSWLAERSISL
jgi:tRNA nucleotidyltransferase (CCA-adding enzyme)